VKGSPQFLRQLVMNLFDNAIKYNRQAGTIPGRSAMVM
jgi:signal transduction histidine kinase